MVLPGNCSCTKVHILFQLLFTKTRVLIYQYSICNYFKIQVSTVKKFSTNIHLSFIEFIQTLSWYVKARLSIYVHMTPDRHKNMINTLRFCYILTHFIGSFSNKVKNFVLTNVNWTYTFFGLTHGL